MRQWIIMLGLVLFSSVFAAEENTPNISIAEEEVTNPDQAVSVAPVAKDIEIEKRISEILASTNWFRQIEVRVEEGIVFLDGLTSNDDHRQWARNLATKTQDVVAVVNRIKIDSTPNWSMEPVLNELERIIYKIIATLPLVLLSLIVLPLAWFVAKFIYRIFHRLFKRQIASPLLADIIAKAIAVPTFLLGVYLVLQVSGLTNIAFSIIGGAGVIGIILGFAFRDIAENFLSSVILSIRRPFTGGDFIEVAGQQGIVQSMNTRTTVLLSSEGNLIQIPNSMVFKNIINNYSASASQRDAITLGIGYDAAISQTQSIILSVLLDHKAVIQDPKPLVLVDNLGAATVNLKIFYWFDGHSFNKFKVRSAILRLLKRRLIEEGISMPDDAREVIFPNGVPVQIQTETNAQVSNAPTQTAQTTSPPLVNSDEEVADQVTASEGNLINERDELESQAEVELPDKDNNLLES